MGIGMGAKATVVPIFAAEGAPTAIRGALGETLDATIVRGTDRLTLECDHRL